MRDDSLLSIVVGQRMATEPDNVESNRLAVLQMVPCLERNMTDLETLLPFVHAIQPF